MFILSPVTILRLNESSEPINTDPCEKNFNSLLINIFFWNKLIIFSSLRPFTRIPLTLLFEKMTPSPLKDSENKKSLYLFCNLIL